MTDEEIRRDVMKRAGWDPDEIDRWLAEHPRPTTIAEQTAILGERMRDLGRAIREGLVMSFRGSGRT